MEAHKLCNVGICAIELANIIASGVTVFLSQILIPCNHRAEQTCQFAKRNGILLFITLRCHELIEGIHIIIVVQHIIPDLVTEIIYFVQVGAALQNGRFVIGQEGVPDVLLGIFKIENKGAAFARMGTIQAGKRLHGGHIPQLLVYIHGVQQRFVKAGLILVGNHQNIILAAVERLTELFVCSDVPSLFIKVHGCLSKRLVAGVIF